MLYTLIVSRQEELNKPKRFGGACLYTEIEILKAG